MIVERTRRAVTVARGVVAAGALLSEEKPEGVEGETPSESEEKPEEKPDGGEEGEPPEEPGEPEEEIFKRPDGVPKDWEESRTDDGKGVKYTDPKDRGTYVKVKKGDPRSSQPGQRYDNVRQQKSGQSFDVNGKKVIRKSQESHIPIEKYKFNPELFK